jgi:hypothetical protein
MRNLLRPLALAALCAALAGCVVYDAPGPRYAYAPPPAYYYGPPVYGSVVIGGGWHHRWH